MLAKNILTVLAFAAAASATPIDGLEKRTGGVDQKCGQHQKASCCDSIVLGIGLNCCKASHFAYKICLLTGHANVNQWCPLSHASNRKLQVAAIKMASM